MSRIKKPQEKKRLALSRERRNVYGENDKASRKNIPRSKQLSHMRIRRSANQALAKVRGEIDESVALEADASTRARTKLLGRKAFKKRPDKPLEIVIKQQQTARLRRAVLGALRKAKIPLSSAVGINAGDFDVYVSFEDASRARDVIRKALQNAPPE